MAPSPQVPCPRRAEFLSVRQVDAGLRGAKTAQSINAAESDQRRGWIVTNEDPAHYYFGPQLALANLDDGDIEESFEVSQDDSKQDLPALVAYRVSGTGAFYRRCTRLRGA